MRTKIRNAIVSLLCFALTVQGPIAAAQGLVADPAPPAGQNELPDLPALDVRSGLPRETVEMELGAYADRIRKLRPALEALRADLDRAQFDIADLNASLNLDPEELREYVRTSIAFEQYPGVLRGARGTLLAGAGNALDQSLLLGALLDDAVYDWRVATATLTVDQAATLVAQMSAGSQMRRSIGDAEGILSALREALGIYGINNSDIDAATRAVERATSSDFFAEQTRADSELILRALDQSNVPTSPESMAEIVEEAREYYFVEYRIDAFHDWQAAHPAFGALTEPDVDRAETFTRVDDDLYHRVQIRAFVEQKVGEKLFVHEVFSTPAYASADLVAKPLSLGLQPNGIDIDNAADIEKVLAESSVFMTTLEGAPAGKAFDLDGRIFDASVIGLDHFGFREIVQAGASQAEQGLSALSGLGAETESPAEADDFITLTGHWVEYTVTAPGGEATTERRYVLDRIGPENRAAGRAEIISTLPLEELAKSLYRSATVMTLAGRPNMAHVLDRFAERLLAGLDLVEAALQNPDTVPNAALDRLEPIEDAVLGLAIESGQALARDVVSYRDSPMLAVLERGFVPGRANLASFERVDVVSTSRRTLSIADDALSPSFSASVASGVWETLAEGAPLQQAGGVPFNTMLSLRDAQAQGIPIRAYTAADADVISSSGHSEQTKADLLETVSRGLVAVAPVRPPDGATAVGWWEVDPTSGQTLGVTTGGYGLSAVEYVGLTLTVVMALLGAFSCISGGGDTACCLVMTAMVAVGAYFVASVLGALAVYALTGATEVGLGASAIGMFGGMGIDLATFTWVSCPAG